jgi:hypothetical protein
MNLPAIGGTPHKYHRLLLIQVRGLLFVLRVFDAAMPPGASGKPTAHHYREGATPCGRKMSFQNRDGVGSG